MEAAGKVLEDLSRGLASLNQVELIAGLLIGAAVALLLRARQVWEQRRAFGYNVYAAYTLRRRLSRLALAGLAGFTAMIAYYLWRSFQEPAATPAASSGSEAASSEAFRLFIPRLAIEAPMIEAPFVARQWDISRLKGEVAHLEGTAYPGEPGNAVLAGHITIPGAGWGPFQELHTLEPGDRVFIEHGDEKFTYVVSEVKVVESDAVEVAFPTRDARLTLITCAGWNETFRVYAQRVIVVASLESGG